MSNFEVNKPIAYPESAPPGPVLINVTIKAFVAGYVTVRMAIYEGSFWRGYGDWIESQDQNVFFSVGQTKTVQFMHQSQYRTQERRDVRIVIFDEWGTLFDSGDKSDWDDVFYVTEPEEPPPDNGEPPPGEVFAGRIISVEPLEQRINSKIDLTIKYEVETFSLIEAINGWWAEAVVTVDGQEGNAQSGMLTGKGPKTLTQRVSFGTMLATNMYGTVDIICYKGGFSGYSELVASQNITLTPSELPPEPPPDGNGEPPPDGNGEPEEGIDWLPVALIGGGVAVALIVLSKPGEKQA